MKKSTPFDDQDDYELMRTLNEQYESNFLRFQKLWFDQQSRTLSTVKEQRGKDNPTY